MKTLIKLKNLQLAGSKVHQNGLKGFSRYQTARLLGLSQIAQFDNPKTLRLDIGCWMLGELSDKGVASQQDFVDEYIFPVFEPGSVSELETLGEVVASSRVSEKLKGLIVNNLHCGESIDSAGLTGIQKQNLKKALILIKMVKLQAIILFHKSMDFIQEMVFIYLGLDLFMIPLIII